MNKLLTGKLSLAIAIACATGCIGSNAALKSAHAQNAPAAPATEPNMTFTEKNDSQTVEAKVGDVFEVRLPSNASTGYSWSIAAQDTEALESEGDPKYVRPDKPMPGAPGQQLFRFLVKRAGSTKLELRYSRPWEKDKAPAQTFSLTLSVTEPEK